MTNYDHIQMSKEHFRTRINLGFLISEIQCTLPQEREKLCRQEYTDFYSESLGLFEFNKDADWYISEVVYGEDEVILNVLTNDESKAKILIFLMEKIMGNLDFIEAKSRINAMEQLGCFHKENKVYEDDTLDELRQFSENMKLISVCVYEDTSVGLWYYFEEDEVNSRILLVKYESYEVMEALDLSWKLNIENYQEC